VGQYTDAAARYLTQTLSLRRQAILNRYLNRLSPIGHLYTQGDTLCGTDLARASGVVPDEGQSFAAQAWDHEQLRPLRVMASPGGKLCVQLERQAANGGYTVVEISNGYAEGLLRAHLYDLGAGRGYRLVGIERI
jgi:hypothetical protein